MSAALPLAGALLPDVAGAWALYPLLGVFPGLAAARLLPLERTPFARLALGLAAAPLVSATAGWTLCAAGVPLAAAARLVAAAGWTVWAALAWRDAAGTAAPEPGVRFAALWAVGAALVVALPLFLNPWLRVYSDAWTHAGIVWEIVERGIPPQDPRFAGLVLNYVWFFNLFIALATRLGKGDPFTVMAIFNSVNLAVTMAVGWALGRRLWGTRAAAGCMILLGVGFNAGAWLLVPLKLINAALGRDRGWAEVVRLFGQLHYFDTRVIFALTAPFAYMASFLDKFLVGTAVSYAYLLMTLYLWALVEWTRAGGRAALVWAASAAAGMLLFHGVVGLSVIPVMLGALALAALARPRWTWLPSRGRLAGFALATLGGALLATPYTLAISRGWSAARSGLRHSYFRIDPWMLWTLATTLAVALWFARRPIRRAFAERRPDAALLVFFALGMGLFAAVVSLPLWNHVKFAYEIFVPLAMLGGVALEPELREWTRRRGKPLTLALVALVFAAPPALTVTGYLADRSGRTAPEMNLAPGESALYRWIRDQTPADAVFLDNDFRPTIMVWGRRQLLIGTRSGPEMAAFPAGQILERRAVMADLYGGRDSFGRDLTLLRGLRRPVYVLIRSRDFPPGGDLEPTLDRAPADFTRVYDHDGFLVYHLNSVSSPSPGEHSP